MSIQKHTKALELNKGPIPPEVLAAGATVLVEVIKSLLDGRKVLRKRVEALEIVCKLQAEQIAQLEKLINKV